RRRCAARCCEGDVTCGSGWMVAASRVRNRAFRCTRKEMAWSEYPLGARIMASLMQHERVRPDALVRLDRNLRVDGFVEEQHFARRKDFELRLSRELREERIAV